MTSVDERASAGPDKAALDYQRKLLGVVMLAVMTFGSLMTIVTVSLDQIASDLNSSRATLTWMITGLMLAVAVVTPIAGKLGDIKGHRRMFLFGLAGGVITTALSAVAWDATSMIVFRVLFGITGAFVTPNGMALMMHAYGPERRATAMGWYQFAMTGAPTVGLVVGGPMIDVVGWRWIFVAFATVSVLAWFVGLSTIRPTSRLEGVSIDYPGAVTLAGTVLAGLLGLTRASQTIGDAGLAAAVTDGPVLGLTAICLAGVVLFINVERRSPEPMLQLRYFRRRTFIMPMLSSALVQFAYMGGFVVTPALLGGVYGYSVSAIALILAPRPGAFSVASPLGGYLASSLGERRPIIAGSMCMVASMAAFALGANMIGAAGLVVIIVGLVLSGVSAGISQPGVASMVVGSVDPNDVGIANGMSQQMTMIGIVIGIQTMNVFLGDDASIARFTSTFLFGGVIASLGLLAAFNARRPEPV